MIFQKKKWSSQNTWTLLTSKLSDHFSNWLAFSLYSRSIIMKERRRKKKKQYCVRKPSEELISVIRQRRTASQPTARQPASRPGSQRKLRRNVMTFNWELRRWEKNQFVASMLYHRTISIHDRASEKSFLRLFVLSGRPCCNPTLQCCIWWHSTTTCTKLWPFLTLSPP